MISNKRAAVVCAINMLERDSIPVRSELAKDLKEFLGEHNEMREEIARLHSELEQAREALSWAEGQFTGIRMYTKDGKVAVACADGEARIKQALKQQEVNNG